jgi:probable phosphoglycerate mutase
VRHGETPSNVAYLLDTAPPGAVLTDRGHQQARSLVQAFENQPVEEIYVSDLVRTQQTAEPLAMARGLSPVVRDGLREIQAGSEEMIPYAPDTWDRAKPPQYFTALASWASGDLAARMPGGESGEEFLDRYDAVINEIAGRRHDCAVVVSHGAAIRMWAGLRCGNLTEPFLRKAPMTNTDAVFVTGAPGAWVATRWAGHPIPHQATR